MRDQSKAFDQGIKFGSLLLLASEATASIAKICEQNRVLRKDPLDGIGALAPWGVQLGIADEVGR
ncbi:MAG: hypothetical protein JKY36_06930 [Erythrobacter sp.]|nr:hypothetical protein [Erythrobacter sp.]